MKITYRLLFTIISLFITSITFSQQLSDEQIGLNLERITLDLQKRGITNPEDLQREIDQMRETFRIQYLEMKKGEDEILQKNILDQKGKSGRGKSVALDISPLEKDALRALYNSTNGVNWRSKAGWDFNNTVVSWDQASGNGWYGITVTDSHVTSILLNNNLTGTIPAQIGDLKYLQVLGLYNNVGLTGSIPKEIGQLINLTGLSLYGNGLSGSIPTEIGLLTNLTSLSLNTNFLTGSIPIEIGKLKKVNTLVLYQNNLNGIIPNELTQLPELGMLMLNINSLTGTLPSELPKLTKLYSLYIYGNLLSGKIPDLTSLSLLKTFDFGSLGTNRFRFDDFANEFSLYKTKITQNFRYYPQAKTDTAKTITPVVGESTTLKMFEDDRFTIGDTFQWYKNNVPISGSTSRIYTLSSLKTTDNGVYSCRSSHVNNPDMSLLILEREPITLNVASCMPIVGTIKVVK